MRVNTISRTNVFYNDRPIYETSTEELQNFGGLEPESIEISFELDGAGGERVVGQDVEERRIGQLGGNLDKEGITRQETTKRDG